MRLLLLVLMPALAGLAALWTGRLGRSVPRWVAMAAAVVNVVLVVLFWPFGGGEVSVQFQWVPQLGINLDLTMDAFSAVLIALTWALGCLAVFASWRDIREKVGFYHANLLWVLTGITGVFLARDLFLFYFMWEVMLVPMYFMIDIWGHEDGRRAAIKFFIFTQASGLFLLVAILGLYWLHGEQTGTYTFSYSALLHTQVSGLGAMLLLLGFYVAFTTKLGVLPLHPWLPDAYTQAPTGGSVTLAGPLLIPGAYGLVRFALPLFPIAAGTLAPVAMVLGVASIIYGAVLAFAQTDLKRLVAYTSISHMGWILLGVFAGNETALAAVAALGMVLAVAYALRIVQTVFHGTSEDDVTLSDFGVREMVASWALIIGLLFLGLYPKPLLKLARPALVPLPQMVPVKAGATASDAPRVATSERGEGL